MSPEREPSALRLQIVTILPSGEKPRVRIDGLISSDTLPWVTLRYWLVPISVSHASAWPPLSARKATKRPSREIAAACSVPDKSASCVTLALPRKSWPAVSCRTTSQ